MAKISRYVDDPIAEEAKWAGWNRRTRRTRGNPTSVRKPKKLPQHNPFGANWKWFRRQPGEFRYLLAYHYARCKKGDIDGKFLQYLLDAQEYRCAYCECALTRENRTLEHHQPICRGGKNTRDNVSWACWDCNMKKGTQTYDEFMTVTGRVEAPGVAVAWSSQGGPDQGSSVVRRAEARSAGVPQRSQVAAFSERADPTLRPDGDGAAPAKE